MPLIQGDWWSKATRPLLKGQTDVETADVVALSITSEKLSANAVARSVVVPIPAQTLGSTALGSTDYVVWRSLVPVVVQRALLMAQTTWLNPANTGVVYLGNACSTMAVLSVTSSQIGVGAMTDLGALSNAAIAACTNIRFAATVGSSGLNPAFALQLDYLTSA